MKLFVDQIMLKEETTLMSDCSFCGGVQPSSILIEGELCYFMDTGDPVLIGGGMILPRAHRETAFDLTKEEWIETQSLLEQAKQLLDEKYDPDGYSVGWNCKPVAGQSHPHANPHANLHIIPRHADEPFAGQGIRHHIKQPENRRPNAR
jgi:histidine triad (HIT) family protein